MLKITLKFSRRREKHFIRLSETCFTFDPNIPIPSTIDTVRLSVSHPKFTNLELHSLAFIAINADSVRILISSSTYSAIIHICNIPSVH